MRLTCPSCGAVASAEAWENDAIIRGMMQALLALPAQVAKAHLGYLAMFRPPARALSWNRAKRLTDEIQAMVAAGYVSVHGKPDRDCPPMLWATGMEQMTLRGPRLQLPLKNHNYLRQIVWQLADEAAARAEAMVRQNELSGGRRQEAGEPHEGGMSEFMRRYIAEHGDPNAKQG